MSADGGEDGTGGGAFTPRRAVLAYPGSLDTPTGGYAYARRLLAECRGGALRLDPWPLPGGFPFPDAAVLDETAERLALLPSGWPVVVDGLALGALPPRVLAAAPGPLIALCHHPLGLETGLDPAKAKALIVSERAALDETAAVIATSAATAQLLQAHFGVASERLTVAEPGTEPARPATGSGGPGVQLLAVGSLIPRKGHDVLLEALSGCTDLDWRLDIAGADDRDPLHAALLRQRIKALGLGERVRLLGALDTDALERAYARADLFALASHYEGYGMVFTEAMARALPVVGCGSEAVIEATRGAAWLVAPGDTAALRHALRALIADPAARTTLGRACAKAGAALPRWSDTAHAVARAIAQAVAPLPSRQSRAASG